MTDEPNNPNFPKAPSLLLTSVKGDKDIAEDLRKRFFVALSPVCELIAEAERNGFEVGFGFGKDAFNKTVIANINLMKKY